MYESKINIKHWQNHSKDFSLFSESKLVICLVRTKLWISFEKSFLHFPTIILIFLFYLHLLCETVFHKGDVNRKQHGNEDIIDVTATCNLFGNVEKKRVAWHNIVTYFFRSYYLIRNFFRLVEYFFSRVITHGSNIGKQTINRGIEIV